MGARTRRVVFLSLTVIGLAGLAAWAQGSAGTVLGCVGPSGVIRSVDETTGSCRAGDGTLSWYTRAGAEALFLRITGKAADADLLDGVDSTAFAATSNVQTLQTTVQALELRISEQHGRFQDLLDTFNIALNGATGDIRRAHDEIAALQQAIAAIGEGALSSYEQLSGLPCVTRVNTNGTVHLVGALKPPVCAVAVSLDGRFSDLGPVVVDRKTNLMWEKKTTKVGSGKSLDDLHDVDNIYDWFTATGGWIDAVNAEGATGSAGFRDWRVPTAAELATILDLEVPKCGPDPQKACIDVIFGPTQASFYWSATGSATSGTGSTVSIHFGTGLADQHFPTMEFAVRAVRTTP